MNKEKDKQKKATSVRLIIGIVKYTLVSLLSIILFLYFLPKSVKSEKLVILSSNINESVRSFKLIVQILKQLSKSGDLYDIIQCSVNAKNVINKNDKTPVVIRVKEEKESENNNLSYTICGQNVSIQISKINDLEKQSSIMPDSFNFIVGKEPKELLIKYPNIREMISQSVVNNTNIFSVSNINQEDFADQNLLYRLDLYSYDKTSFSIPKYILTKKSTFYTSKVEPTCNSIVAISYRIFDIRNNILHQEANSVFKMDAKDVPDIIKYIILRMKKDDVSNIIFGKNDIQQLTTFQKIPKEILLTQEAVVIELELKNVLK